MNTTRDIDGPTPLKRAIAAVDITAVWHALGLPGKPGKSCASPFREDRHPSFSVFDNGTMAKDHATGEIFDLVDFIAAALNAEKPEAARWLIEYAGTGRSNTSTAPRKAPERPRKAPEKQTRKLSLPPLDGGTYGEICALQSLRGLPMNAGLEVLRMRKLLHFATLPEGRAWILTDLARRNAQARLLNGDKFGIGAGIKAKTMPRSEAAWPIGLADAADRETVLLCEGGPDMLAVATAAWIEADGGLDCIGFIFMAGASLSIPADAVEKLAGKRIRIYGHCDEPGRAAARKWFGQLSPVAAGIDYWEPEKPGTDLNDLITQHLAALSWGADLPERITPHEKTPGVDAPEA